MKQRISIRAIVRVEGETLLLRRANGRASIMGKYELPGGKIAYGEQPEDALRRYLHDDAGLHVQTAQLFDAVTYIDRDDRDIQYIVVVYMVAVAGDRHKPQLSANYDEAYWGMLKNIQQKDCTDLTDLLLGIIQQDVISEEIVTAGAKKDVSVTSKDRVIIYSDGGSRGNPGPSAAGFVLVNEQQELVEQGGEYLGVTTNGQAEYQGVRLGLERAIELGYTRIECRIDSMMVVNQMNGIYKIKSRELWPIHDRIRDLVKQCESVTFSHVKREFNTLADGMVNKTLDQYGHSRV